MRRARVASPVPEPLDPGTGIAAATALVRSRPARLGPVRLVAVDGPSGSGKTHLSAPLASAIATSLGGTVVRPIRTRDRTRDRTRPPADEPAPDGWSPQRAGPIVTVVSTDLLATWEDPLGWWPVVEEHLLAPLAAGRCAELPVVQWISGNPRPGGAVWVPAVDVLVLEGVSAGRSAVADRLTLLVWVEVIDRAQRLERAVARDGEQMRQFLAPWQDAEDAHYSADGTRERADVVITP